MMQKLTIISMVVVFILSAFATVISADFYVIAVQKKDPNLVPENIKAGVIIFGVEGELYGGCTCAGTLNGTRWCDNGDGTVTDLSTCLVWLQNANCTDTLAGISKSAGSLIWDEAIIWGSVVSSGTCGLSDGSIEGDWHLPTESELASLTNGTEAVSSITPRAFAGVQSNYYWSSTTYYNASFPDLEIAWTVNMETYHQNINFKEQSHFVWPVRAYD